jgi:molybdopterin/thiamine biosynthesis adenylyltransferase
LDDPQLLRYSRHILLDDVGVDGQDRIAASSALIVGAGGLGSPVALYLAAAGVGRITIADGDAVDLTNLQRQIAHATSSIGINKAESAARTMGAINPEVEVAALPGRLRDAELDNRVAAADVVIDCSDNFATRHAINRACVRHRKPLVSGAAVRWDGQMTVFDAARAESPCYACLFPEGGGADELRCAENGVFSPLVGVIGTMQALEALKIVAGCGASLVGRLILFDARTAGWREVRVPRDPLCGVCGAHSGRTAVR